MVKLKKKADTKQFYIGLFISIFLAIAPILDPYIIAEIGSGFTLRVNDVLIIMLAFACFIKYMKVKLKFGFLLIWCAVLMFLTCIATIACGVPTSIMVSCKNIIIWTVYAALLGYVWSHGDRDIFFKTIEKIGIALSVIVIIQFICGNLSIPFWNGKIPLLNLSKYDGWAGFIDPNTGDIRPNGFLQEPSYVGVYLLPLYAYKLKSQKVLKSLFFAISLALTSSLVAICGLVVITIYLLVFSKSSKISKQTFFAILIIMSLSGTVITFVSQRNSALGDLVGYVQNRVYKTADDLSGERDSSSKLRIYGNIGLFEKYTGVQKLFGFGVGQHPIQFDVRAYSNIPVTMILDLGYVGLLAFLAMLFGLFKSVKKDNRVFFLIFVMVICVDYMWFNWYFYYLLSACMLNENRISKTGGLTNERMLVDNNTGV